MLRGVGVLSSAWRVLRPQHTQHCCEASCLPACTNQSVSRVFSTTHPCLDATTSDLLLSRLLLPLFLSLSPSPCSVTRLPLWR
jgi:hypothetical protein